MTISAAGIDPAREINLLNIGLTDVDTVLIERICELNDDVYRNQLITYVYSRLSKRLAAQTGGDANWFTFARWSSFTVGENLRVDKPSAAFSELISRYPLGNLFRGPLTRLQHDLRLMSDAAMPRTLAIGNRLVFHEIAWAVAAFLDWYEGALSRPTIEDWFGYREQITPTPASDLFQACDVEWLRDGIEAYFRAAIADGAAAKTRLVLRGNVLLAAYEQWRLQPIVRIALDPIAKHLVEFVGTNLHTDAKMPQAILRRRGTPYAFEHSSPVNQWLSEMYGRFLTQYVMAWQGPVAGMKGALFLGEGIPNPPKDTSLYAPVLASLDHPDLLIVKVFDRSFGTQEGRGAHNWTRFNDRMNFIVNLFRAEQGEEALFDPLSDREMRILDLDLSDEKLDSLRPLGDEKVDNEIVSHCSTEAVDPRTFVRKLIADEFPKGGASFVDCELPPWANTKKLEMGQQFLCEHGLEISSALFF